MRLWPLICLAALTACGGPGEDSPGDDATSGAYLTSRAPANHRPVPYHGGAVLHRPREINLYWGGYWTTATGEAARSVLDDFAARAGGTDWFAITAQYTDSSGPVANASVAGPAALVSGEPPAKLKDLDIRHFVRAQLDAGTVPWDPEGIYFVFTPPGVSVELNQSLSCKDYCAYHLHFRASLSGPGDVDVKYGAIPHLSCPATCGTGSVRVNGPLLDALTSAVSHELAETASDPDLDAWEAMHANDEIGDRCSGNFAANWDGRRFAVQQIWSNRDLACVSGM